MAEPEPMNNEPLLPELEVPVLSTNKPLIPEVPALAVLNSNAPLEDDAV